MSTSLVDEVVNGRRSVYGNPVETFARIAQMWSAQLGVEIQPWQVPLMFISVKLIRTGEAPDYSDNSDDIEGYLAIFREVIGEDMIHARSVSEYLFERSQRGD